MSCFIFHEWTKWEDAPIVWESPLLSLILKRSTERTEIGQRRICKRCGKEELRTKDT